MKELKITDQKLANELTREKQAKKDAEAKILKQVDENIYQTRLDISRSQRSREESEQRNADELNEDISQLQEAIQ